MLRQSTDINRFFEATSATRIAKHHPALEAALAADATRHGDTDDWEQALQQLPQPTPSALVFNQDTLEIGPALADPDIPRLLKALMPWRKGPFKILGTFIDTEWRSDWKWQRLVPHISPLENKLVLDIGCGNGYHLFRMLGEGARMALGIDPTLLFNYQFQLIQQLITDNHAYLLPLCAEQLPPFGTFDTVFSLGVLYHRRSPLGHLSDLLSFLAPKGELILETLVIDGDENTLLIPRDRYARMANVWFIPSTLLLEQMLHRVGFTHIRTLEVTTTSTEEQRSTEWMSFQSLSDCLDPQDPRLTVEGYPAPKRALVIANRRQAR